MAELELRTSDGKTERRELSRTQPLSIGRQSFNDIAIPEDDVGSLHCRIGWAKAGYELTSAQKDGVDLNGKFVQHSVLKPGDVMRIGSMDLIFRDAAAPKDDRDKEKARESGARNPAGSEKHKHRPHAKEVNEPSLFEGPVIAESLAEMVANPEVIPESAEMSGLLLARNLSQGEAIPREGERPRASAGASPQLIPDELKRNVRAALAADRVRPGEQEVFKSPLVLGLGIGGLVVLLVTATIWFLMGRQVSNRLYDLGVAELGEGKYTQAIATFEKFIQAYPKHSLNPDARIGVGKARIQKELSGATPSWQRGMEQLESFLEEHRNDPDFKLLQPGICQFAEQIAFGSVKTAEQVKDPDLLTVCADATRRLEQFSDPQNPPVVALEQLREATEKAKAAIRKQKTIDETFAIIDQAVKEKQPIIVLRERAKLLQIYPDVVGLKRVRDALQKAIDLEKSVVNMTDLDQPATTTEEPFDPQDCAVVIDHTRSRTDESASGRHVYAVAHGACFALDAVTGETAWRVVVGSHPPFFPVPTSGAQPGLLLGETQPPALALRQAETGALIWRQALAAPILGAPLVYQGEIFVAASDRRLYRLDLDTGRLKEEAVFSQDIVGPPAVSPSGDQLIVAGESALIYTLSIRPLKVTAVTFTAHAAGAVRVPLMTMGRLLLMCENDRLDSAKLRVWDAENPEDGLTEAKFVRIEGQVFDRPVLRGSQLVIASSGERLHAFTVSDDPEKKGLAPIGEYKVQDGYQGPMQLALGPDQQFWLASSAFRRFQVSNESIRADQNTTAPGIASQPLQIVGDQFFVGRRPPYAEGVVFTQVDRERMAGSWRTVVGARFLAWTESRTGGIVAVSEAGTVFAVTASRLQQGGIEQRAGVALEIPPDVTEPLGATRLSDGRLAVWCSGSQPKLWLINTLGQIEGEYKLDAALQAAPILLSKGLILPQPGRLKWLSPSRDGVRVQDYVAPVEEGEIVRWAHLAALDDKELIACDANGRLSKLQIRQDDVVHLAESAKFQLPQPVDLKPLVQGDEFWVADASATLYRLDARSLDVKSQRTFPAAISGVWTDGIDRFVQLLGGELHAITDAEGLPDRWTAPLAGLEMLSSPVKRNEQLIWVDRQGSVVQLDAATGNELSRTKLPLPLAQGLMKFGDALFCSSVDGAVYRIRPPQGGQP